MRDLKKKENDPRLNRAEAALDPQRNWLSPQQTPQDPRVGFPMAACTGDAENDVLLQGERRGSE
jgi:hypothetical protein